MLHCLTMCSTLAFTVKHATHKQLDHQIHVSSQTSIHIKEFGFQKKAIIAKTLLASKQIPSHVSATVPYQLAGENLLLF
uniref:SP8 binding family protein n=1 Tax=Rhizophora mucronata TaxID=61149 RepID=A0A2P2NIS3_RHIMU